MRFLSPRLLAVVVVVVAIGVSATDVGVVPMIVATLFATLFLRVGVSMIGAMAQPVPEPPPPGELRKVKIGYRCSICGSELRMTVANDEVPEPPKHCLEEMDLVAPIFE